MEPIVDLEWRWVACLALVAVGLWWWLRAVGDWRNVRKAAHRNLRHMVAFRKAMLGIGFAGVGLGWWTGNPVVFWFGVIVALEETIESSIALVGLRMEAAEQRQR
jgi:hypothetical protein